jgi:NAD(P)-dependent dehydrogenase (short-subunit alcohol dehydrogenase family)
MGSFLCAREAVRRMARSRGGAGGAIVSISSAAARTGSPNYWVHYAASKAAVDVMTIGLAKEVAADGIRVNAIRPGVIDTEIHAAAPPDVVARMTQAIPMKRLGQPDEVARLAVWLLGEQASYVTGALIDAGGGY